MAKIVNLFNKNQTVIWKFQEDKEWKLKLIRLWVLLMVHITTSFLKHKDIIILRYILLINISQFVKTSESVEWQRSRSDFHEYRDVYSEDSGEN